MKRCDDHGLEYMINPVLKDHKKGIAYLEVGRRMMAICVLMQRWRGGGKVMGMKG